MTAMLIGPRVTVVDGLGRLTPEDAFCEGLPGLLVRVAARAAGGPLVLLVGPAVAGRLGLPVGELPTGPAAKTHPAAVAARVSGWDVAEVHRWSTFSRGSTVVHIGLTEHIDEAHCGLIQRNAMDTTGAFAAWQDVTGVPFWGDAGDAVNAIVQRYARCTWKGRPMTPVWRARRLPVDGEIERTFTAGGFVPDPAPGGRWRFGFDAVRAYLSAMTVCEVAPGVLRHDRVEFDPGRAGWWLVECAPWTDRRLPDPRGVRGDGWDGPVWLTTPTLKLLAQLDTAGRYGGFRVLDAYTAPASRGVLRPAAEQVDRALTAAAGLPNPQDRAAVWSTLKAGYQAVHGKWRVPRSEVYRPDWAAALVATARTNLWRRIADAAGRGWWPSGVGGIDTVYYAHHDDQAPAVPGFDLGDRLGRYQIKHKEEVA